MEMKNSLLDSFLDYLGLNRPYSELGGFGKFCRILFYTIRRFGADEHSQRAIALTYYTLFAIVPLAALLFGIAKGFNLEKNLRVFLIDRFSDHKEVLGMIIQFADTTLKEAQGGLIAGIGVIALIWTVMWLAFNIEGAFNKVWNLPGRRNIFRKFSDYLAIVILIPLLMVIIGSAGVFIRNSLDKILELFPWVKGGAMMSLSAAVEILPIVIVVVIFSLIYYMVPNTKVRVRSAVLAGVVAGVLYQLMQNSFIVLQMSISRYNTIYGSFAALPLFLIWVQWSWLLTLFGAELSYVCQNIQSGLFERKSKAEVSHTLRRDCQLAIARMVVKHFEAGSGAMPVAEIGEKMSLWPIQLNDYLEEMFNAGVLFRTAAEDKSVSCLPGFPAETLTIVRVLELLDHSGNNELEDITGRQLAPIEEREKKLVSVMTASADNLPLRDI